MTRIFVSHASGDAQQANDVSMLLRQATLEPIVDIDEVRTGDSFITFMEEALSRCDYCLLLWSLAASRGRWVREEWQGAYYRSVTESQSFLVIGRLEDLDPPVLLRPRSRVDLFPNLEQGIAKLVAMWRNDEAAGEASGRPVRPPKRPLPAHEPGTTVYVSSKIFGKTFPFEADLSAPAALLTENVVNYLGAPRQQDHGGLVGARYNWNLSNGRKTLDPAQSLEAQSVSEKSLLWLQVEITPFAHGETVGEAPQTSTFRGELDEARRKGSAALLGWTQSLGLGP